MYAELLRNSTEMIRTLEEISMNAWPALKTIYYDGWVIRFANGYSRRANSVNPICDSKVVIDEKIRRCEQLYKSAEQKVIFKLTDAASPADLDTVLDLKGYEPDAPTSVQTLDLAHIGRTTDDDITINDKPTEDWLRQFIVMSKTDGRYLATLQEMLGKIAPKKGFFSITRESRIVACGLAVVDKNYVGLFDILTDPAHRRQGLGTRISANMLRWGKANGAKTAYLQVMDVNKPALRLYENLGFDEAYKYWYRVKE
jgi:GNAT superfamily N-acetyltransferase